MGEYFPLCKQRHASAFHFGEYVRQNVCLLLYDTGTGQAIAEVM